MKEYMDPELKKRLPLDWIEPVEPESDDHQLVSFSDLQRKTILTLYGAAGDDKSPKGSVDGPIRPLVDLINRHSSYCTLSSCSGRLSLFDPNGRHEGMQGSTTPDRNENEDNNNSGKGVGGWLLISHHPVKSTDLVDCFPPENENTTDSYEAAPWIFKLEPMLLHIAARSLLRGKQLLQIALELGFRESGLVVSESRVTVAIRGHSLALSVPLAPKGALRPQNAYLHALVDQANLRLLQNWYQLDRLYERISSTLFRISASLKLEVNPIPPINLWNAAAVASTSSSEADCNIFVFGGYGIGPRQNLQSAKRSSEMYQSKKIDSTWESDWRQLSLKHPSRDSDRLDNLPVTWVSEAPACQGVGVCRLECKNWIIFWGGRTSPTKALDSLLIFNPNDQPCCLAAPLNIEGSKPSPRWGHTLHAVDLSTLMVIGGRDDDGKVFDDMYLLHFCDTFFFWEQVSIKLPRPLFHHMAFMQESSLVVCGGLTSTTNTLEAFETTPEISKIFAYRLEKDGKSSDGSTAFRIRRIPNISSNDEGAMNGLFRFAASVCSLDSITIVSGGLPAGNADVSLEPIAAVHITSEKDRCLIKQLPLEFSPSEEVVDFGSLVHHTCVPINNNEFLLLGGGVASFAFGNNFAKSYDIRIETSSTNPFVPAVTNKKGLTSTDEKKTSATTKVVMVEPHNAKPLKKALEAAGWLDKRYRMTKLDSLIAVPVTLACWDALSNSDSAVHQESWNSMIIDKSLHEMPFSTSQFAAKVKR